MSMFSATKDDVTKNRLPELTSAVKGKMQKCINCDDKDMDFWFIALSLQCTRIYMKYHMDDLDEMKSKCSAHPIIGLPFGIVEQLTQTEDIIEAFNQVNQLAYENMDLVVSAIIRRLNDNGTHVYERYGLAISKDQINIMERIVEDDAMMTKLVTFLNEWSLNRLKKRDNIGTLFDLIVCTFYYLLRAEDAIFHDMNANKVLMYSNSVASFSDYFWTGNHTEYGRMEGILNMSVNELSENIEKLFTDGTFIREVLTEYLYIVERGHEGKLL